MVCGSYCCWSNHIPNLFCSRSSYLIIGDFAWHIFIYALCNEPTTDLPSLHIVTWFWLWDTPLYHTHTALLHAKLHLLLRVISSYPHVIAVVWCLLPPPEDLVVACHVKRSKWVHMCARDCSVSSNQSISLTENELQLVDTMSGGSIGRRCLITTAGNCDKHGCIPRYTTWCKSVVYAFALPGQ